MDVCTLGNGQCGEFFAFLEALDDEKQQSVLCLLDRVAKQGCMENAEILRPIHRCVGIFNLAFDDVYLVCFRLGRKIVICKHGTGDIAPDAVPFAQLRHNHFLRAVTESSTHVP